MLLRGREVIASNDGPCSFPATQLLECWSADLDPNRCGPTGFAVALGAAGSASKCPPGADRKSCIRVCALSTAPPSSAKINCLAFRSNEYKSTTPVTGGPVPPIPLTGVTDFAVLKNVGCALHAGKLSCWDFNDKGTIVPKEIAGVAGPVDFALGGFFGKTQCAVTKAGRVMCWTDKYNDEGILGTGDLKTHNTPKPVTGITDAISVRLSTKHGCALHRTGKVSCWGTNDREQVGAKLAPTAFTPVVVGP